MDSEPTDIETIRAEYDFNFDGLQRDAELVLQSMFEEHDVDYEEDDLDVFGDIFVEETFHQAQRRVDDPIDRIKDLAQEMESHPQSARANVSLVLGMTWNRRDTPESFMWLSNALLEEKYSHLQ